MAELDNVSEALARAQEHLDVLNGQIREFLERKPYEFLTKLDPDRAGYREIVRLTEDPPLRWRGITRDCVNNVHAALDYIAWGLSKPLGGTRTSFPIFVSEADWRRFGGDRKIEHVPVPAKARIKGLQPYKRMPQRPHSDALWQLYELSIVSKHREPHLTAYLVETGAVRISTSGCGVAITGQADLYAGVAFERETEILTYRVTKPRRDPKVEMQHHVALDVAFAKGGPCGGQKVRPTLQRVIDHVRDVVVPEVAEFL